MLLPQRRPLTTIGPIAERSALAVALPAGYTRLLLPAYAADRDAPALPLFGYTFACVVDDRLHVAAMRTDEGEDWEPRTFGAGELEGIDRAAASHAIRTTACCGKSRCARASTAVSRRRTSFWSAVRPRCPVSPQCNARCIGCISEQEPDAGVPSPQARDRPTR